MWLRPFINRVVTPIEEARAMKTFSFKVLLRGYGEAKRKGETGHRRSVGRGKMPRSGSVYQLRAFAHQILSTVYAIDKRTKLIVGRSRAGDAIDGTKLALLLTEAKLRTVFISQRRSSKNR